MTPDELSDIRTQLAILEARKCPEGDCPLLYPGCGCNRSKMLEHIDSQAVQIATLKTALIQERAANLTHIETDSRVLFAMGQLAREMPDIFKEDMK
jgi:hypothetical protein